MKGWNRSGRSVIRNQGWPFLRTKLGAFVIGQRRQIVNHPYVRLQIDTFVCRRVDRKWRKTTRKHIDTRLRECHPEPRTDRRNQVLKIMMSGDDTDT